MLCRCNVFILTGARPLRRLWVAVALPWYHVHEPIAASICCDWTSQVVKTALWLVTSSMLLAPHSCGLLHLFRRYNR